MVQSFPKGELVDPVTAHACALELAKWYQDYEVLVCTHVEREHIHSHFIINSVNLETGLKLHMAVPQLQELRAIGNNLNQLTTLANMKQITVVYLDKVAEGLANISAAVRALQESRRM